MIISAIPRKPPEREERPLDSYNAAQLNLERPCFICGHPGICQHREPELVELALEARRKGAA